MTSSNSLTVTIAHDYLCPWCWVGYFQAVKLAEEFPQLKLDWIGYELLPEELGPLPDYKPRPRDPDKPLSRFELFAQAEGHPVPEGRTVGVVRTHNPLEGAEYFKHKSPEDFDAYNEAVYRAFWEQSLDISDLAVLGKLVAGLGKSGSFVLDFQRALSAKEYYNKVVRFDDDAYANDVTHVMTFIFRGERCAEAPTSTIRDLAQRYLIWYDKRD